MTVVPMATSTSKKEAVQVCKRDCCPVYLFLEFVLLVLVTVCSVKENAG